MLKTIFFLLFYEIEAFIQFVWYCEHFTRSKKTEKYLINVLILFNISYNFYSFVANKMLWIFEILPNINLILLLNKVEKCGDKEFPSHTFNATYFLCLKNKWTKIQIKIVYISKKNFHKIKRLQISHAV